MHLILSRKGFDSANGGVASPVFPDGSMISLPIPWPQPGKISTAKESLPARVKFADLRGGRELGSLVADLTGGTVQASHGTHLDPDLDASSVERDPEWRPAFGQMDAAQSHLATLGVGKGDLFLFFGWFRAVEKGPAKWRYCPDAPDRHVLFGWLQIGEVVSVESERHVMPQRRPWLAKHPHFDLDGRDNTVYVASERLALEGVRCDGVPGAGLFRRFSDDLVLTTRDDERRRRSQWSLPSWFHPDGRTPLSYHANMHRWRKTDSGVELTTVGRGQEFVLDCAEYPEAVPWAAKLIVEHGVSGGASFLTR